MDTTINISFAMPTDTILNKRQLESVQIYKDPRISYPSFWGLEINIPSPEMCF